jgi:hypothetical protein
MIGITTWGCVSNRESLEVNPKSFNYGYITRNPIEYDDSKCSASQETALLEQNHSHFLLVSTLVLFALPFSGYNLIK